MKLFLLSHSEPVARLYLVAPDLISALELILDQSDELADSDNPIVTDLVAVKNRDLPINDFVMDVTIDRYPVDEPSILISDVPDGVFDNLRAWDIVPEKDLISALQQIGGIYEPFRLPPDLQRMNMEGTIGDTLVICHGRSSRQLSFPGFNPTTAWFVDRNRRVNPDLATMYEDLPLDEMPKFRRVIFVYCPASNQPIGYTQAFDFANTILIPGGAMIYVLPQLWEEPENQAHRKEFDQFARQHGWRQQSSLQVSLGDSSALAAVFIKPGPSQRKTQTKR